jgi:hypothetical protein
MRLLVAAKSEEQLHAVVPAVHRQFVDARAQAMEETLGTPPNRSWWRCASTVDNYATANLPRNLLHVVEGCVVQIIGIVGTTQL